MIKPLQLKAGNRKLPLVLSYFFFQAMFCVVVILHCILFISSCTCMHPSIHPFPFNLFLHSSAKGAVSSPLWPPVWLACECLLQVNALANQSF